MSQVVHATFDDGVLKPDVPLDLAPQTRVRLLVEPLFPSEVGADDAWSELERLWDEVDIDSGGPPPACDSLHDRN